MKRWPWFRNVAPALLLAAAAASPVLAAGAETRHRDAPRPGYSSDVQAVFDSAARASEPDACGPPTLCDSLHRGLDVVADSTTGSFGHARVTGSATIGVRRRELHPGKLLVHIHVDDSPAITGRSRLSPA